MLSLLDRFKELMQKLEGILADTLVRRDEAKRECDAAMERYRKEQERSAARMREIEETRRRNAIERERMQQQHSRYYSHVGAYNYGYGGSSSSSGGFPMIQTHDDSVFPMGTSSSTIRNCLMAMGTFEGGHGPIADCPTVDI
jgi:hypothetical protein